MRSSHSTGDVPVLCQVAALARAFRMELTRSRRSCRMLRVQHGGLPACAAPWRISATSGPPRVAAGARGIVFITLVGPYETLVRGRIDRTSAQSPTCFLSTPHAAGRWSRCPATWSNAPRTRRWCTFPVRAAALRSPITNHQSPIKFVVGRDGLEPSTNGL